MKASRQNHSLKKSILFLFLISIFGSICLQGQITTNFNFSKASQPVTGWINISGDPTTGVRVGSDPTAGINITSIATANWANYNGSSAADGGGAPGGTFFPAAVMLNHWFQFGGFYGLYNSALPQLEISGLKVDSVYTIKMTGSFITNVPGTFNLNPMRFTVSGAIIYTGISINGNFNTSGGATFNNIASDANGKIRIYVNTFSGSNVASINGIQIIRGRTAAPAPNISITRPLNNEDILKNRTVTITASASETNGAIGRVEFFLDSNKIGEDSLAPYSIVWPVNKEGSSIIKVRAIDTLGNTQTTSITVNIKSLNTYWSVLGNIGTKPDSNFLGTTDSLRLSLRTKSLERLSILPDGKIGIGVKTPTAQLHTTGSVRFGQFKNDSLFNSVLTTDTNGNIKLKSFRFSGGVIEKGDSVTLGGTVLIQPFQLTYKNALDPKNSINITSAVNSLSLYKLSPVRTFPNPFLTVGLTLYTSNPTAPPLGSSLRYVTDSTLIAMFSTPLGGSIQFSLGYFVGGTLSIGSNHLMIYYFNKIQFPSLPNYETADSLLTTDTQGKLMLKSLSSFGTSGHWQGVINSIFNTQDTSVGIGTSNTAGYRLAVNGTALFTSITVKAQNAWPDYVFHRDYHLPELKDLERYLKKNRHLPGISSKDEIQKNGIELGDNLTALLKKTEELTLYLINQEKRQAAQTQEILVLDKQSKQMIEQEKMIDLLQEQLNKLKKKRRQTIIQK
ncbi:Ig-like domain-containing protein [Flavitalea flava]